jgi:hypothetical protein
MKINNRVISHENEPYIIAELSANPNPNHNGDIILQDELHLTGYELNDELREKQAKKIINMY